MINLIIVMAGDDDDDNDHGEVQVLFIIQE